MQVFTFVLLFLAIHVITYVCNKMDLGSLTEWEKSKRKKKRFGRHEKKYARKHQPTINAKKIAKGLKGEVIWANLPAKIRFTKRKLEYELQIVRGRNSFSIRLVSVWPDIQFRMRVQPDHRRGTQIMLGQQDILVGDPDFDFDFVIQSSDPNLAIQVLDDTVRRRMREHRKYAHKRISVSIVGGTIEFGGMVKEIFTTQQILAMAKNFAKIHRLMIEATHKISKIEMTLVQNDTCMCSVCGDTVERHNDSVSCNTCETVYHLECWNYIGKCSTYGCRSRKYKIDP